MLVVTLGFCINFLPFLKATIKIRGFHEGEREPEERALL